MTRTFRRTLLGTVAFVAIGLAVAFASTPPGQTDNEQGAAVSAYRSGPLQRLISQVGSLVVYQIKPALSDLGHGRIAPARFQAQATAWVTDISFAQQQFDSCAPPAPLRPATDLYDTALQQYIEAVRAFNAAAAGPVARRISAMHSAAQIANGADAIWNHADQQLTTVLRHYGLRADRPVTSTSVVGC